MSLSSAVLATLLVSVLVAACMLGQRGLLLG